MNFQNVLIYIQIHFLSYQQPSQNFYRILYFYWIVDNRIYRPYQHERTTIRCSKSKSKNRHNWWLKYRISYTCINTYSHTYIHTHINTQMYVHIHACMHIHTCIIIHIRPTHRYCEFFALLHRQVAVLSLHISQYCNAI